MNRKERRQQAKRQRRPRRAAGDGGGDVEAMLGVAVKHHQAGRLAEAEALYRRVLAARPGQPDALHFLGVLAYQSGRHEAAAELIGQAIAANSTNPGYHANLGNVLKARGEFDAALAAYHQAIALMPDFGDAHFNLGNTLQATGRMDEAAEAFRRAADIDPNAVEAHYNLGNALLALETPEEAEMAYRRVLALQPDHAGAHNNLGSALLALDRREEARAAFEHALAVRPDYAEAHYNLGVLLRRQAQPRPALGHFDAALEASPEAMQYHHARAEALAQVVPAWHFPMMNDGPRNAVFQQAIEKAVTPGSRVFEVGTGSGLLAMMAARAGAARVTSCEVVPEIAERARAVVEANGLADRVTVLAKGSTEVAVGEDLDARCDLLIAEIISDGLIGEGVAESLHHARRELLEPGGQVIPRGGTIMAALVGAEGLSKFVTVDEVSGFDLSAFNTLAPLRVTLVEGSFSVEYLSRPEAVFAYDFTADIAFEPPRTIAFEALDEGTCVGLVQWIRLAIDDEITIENRPGGAGGHSHWHASLYRFLAPVAVTAGQRVHVRAEQSGADSLFFQVVE